MKVAILIPTLNRPSFIQRTVMYYDSLKSPHPIYIGDASNTEISENTLSFLKQIKNVEVKYFHWEGLTGEKTTNKLNDNNLYGFELEQNMTILATLNMILNGDGLSKINYDPNLGSILNKYGVGNPFQIIQLDPTSNNIPADILSDKLVLAPK